MRGTSDDCLFSMHTLLYRNQLGFRITKILFTKSTSIQIVTFLGYRFGINASKKAFLLKI
jgi:hypothetical protein